MTSFVCDEYRTGTYFSDLHRHSEDGEFKANEFIQLLRANCPLEEIKTFAEVGCGAGATTSHMVEQMRKSGYLLTAARGYDVSPHVRNVIHPFIRFIHQDFTDSDDPVDLVTLLDVVEHVPDPIGFLKKVADHARLIVLHLPLDGSLNLALRNHFRRNLKDPGHLLVLDPASALNLIAFAGLRVIDYRYTPSFIAPGSRQTLLEKLLYPIRRFLSALSPWLVAKTLGGISLMVLAQTPLYLADNSRIKVVSKLSK
jgi:SAM-dependent methyltransferase